MPSLSVLSAPDPCASMSPPRPMRLSSSYYYDNNNAIAVSPEGAASDRSWHKAPSPAIFRRIDDQGPLLLLRHNYNILRLISAINIDYNILRLISAINIDYNIVRLVSAINIDYNISRLISAIKGCRRAPGGPASSVAK